MDAEIGYRIADIIKSLEIKKVHFAERLKIDQSYVTQLTNGRRNPSERLISDICREFGVDENWLRTGKGEMFVPITRSQEIADFVGKLLKGEEDTFKRRFIAMLARLDENDWKVLEQKALELAEGSKKD